MDKSGLVFIFVILNILYPSYNCLHLEDNSHELYQGNYTLGRYKRQSTACKGDRFKFQCETNPDCIDTDLQCDGKDDCPDGSDEKQSHCKDIICPGYLFKCDYGACVNGQSKCDGKKDCKDNSDEVGCSTSPRINSNCRSDEFECDNGQCIESDGRCNGVVDCEDKSDETESLCLNTLCPGYTYKCKYGACVDGRAECNGIKECYDNSDEDNKNCDTQEPPITTKEPPVVDNRRKCVTPNQPTNGRWNYLPDESLDAKPKKIVPAKTQIIFRCDDMYQLSSSSDRDEEIIYCRNDGQWSLTVFPECLRICPKVYNQHRAVIECRLRDSRIPCDRATSDTQLTYKCDPYYERVSDEINICKDGTWQSQEPRCTEVCGEKQVSAQTLIVNGKVVKRGHYPWVVAIYSNKDDPQRNFINICGGSILSLSVVLTAAHCVTSEKDGTVYHKKFYRAAAGKYFNKFSAEDSDTAQFRKVKEIVKHYEYLGQIQNFKSDIALLKLEEKLVLSKVVQPVCFNRQLPVLGYRGTATVTGWGYTTATGKPSEVLMEIDLEYVDNETCRSELDVDFANQYLVSDKLCAGFFNRSMAVCRGDSGGGLVVKSNNNRYFLQGLVSLAHSFNGPAEKACNIQRRALFTRVEKYLFWILENFN